MDVHALACGPWRRLSARLRKPMPHPYVKTALRLHHRRQLFTCRSRPETSRTQALKNPSHRQGHLGVSRQRRRQHQIQRGHHQLSRVTRSSCQATVINCPHVRKLCCHAILPALAGALRGRGWSCHPASALSLLAASPLLSWPSAPARPDQSFNSLAPLLRRLAP